MIGSRDDQIKALTLDNGLKADAIANKDAEIERLNGVISALNDQIAALQGGAGAVPSDPIKDTTVVEDGEPWAEGESPEAPAEPAAP